MTRDTRHATRKNPHAVLIAYRLLLVAGTLTLGACEPSGLSSEWRRVDPPVAAPDFTLTQLDGGAVTLSKLRGRVVVLDFWATWCGPCRFSLPSLEVIYKQYQDHGVIVLLVNEGEEAATVRQWAQRRFTAPILLDRDEHVAQLYHATGLPTSLIIDQSGYLRYVHEGYGGGLEHSLSAILSELLVKKQEQPPIAE